jgi:hypothetical protein
MCLRKGDGEEEQVPELHGDEEMDFEVSFL